MDTAFSFTTEFVVRIGDINYGGHMGNDKYLLLFHDARLCYLASLGFSEMDIGGAGLIMSEAQVSYRTEVFLGDILVVGVRVADLGTVRFKMEYSVERKSDGKLVATGFTSMAAFDYGSRRITKVPESFRAAVSG